MKSLISPIVVVLGLLIVAAFTSKDENIEKIKKEAYQRGFEEGSRALQSQLMSKEDLETFLDYRTYAHTHTLNGEVIKVYQMEGHESAHSVSYIPFINTNNFKLNTNTTNADDPNHDHIDFKLAEISIVNKSGKVIGKQAVAYDLSYAKK